MVLVVFHSLEIIFCYVVARFDLVHDMGAIFHLP